LHFGNKNRFANDAPNELGKAFCRALKAATDEIGAEADISVVIVTGDVAESGLPSEFGCARDFLRSFADQFSLSPDRFVILPGNHDISWDDCQIVRAGLKGEKFPPQEFDQRLNTEKLGNYRRFLAEFYGAPVTDGDLAGIPDTRPLECGGWLRDFPKLRLSVAALNTSERENDSVKGGYLSVNQAQSLMARWRETDAASKIKIIALHHNPVPTTAANTKLTIEWLRTEEQKAEVHTPMSVDIFERYVGDLAGFEGRERLSRIVRDTAAHLVLHGHHHDQGDPILWPWERIGLPPRCWI
jgi:3',5'-cyclic AMP phosphodiesterase CpdA